jgi:hypothetical protein
MRIDSLYTKAAEPVECDGKTSNRLKAYLSRFWDFYQVSPGLQKVLENT